MWAAIFLIAFAVAAALAVAAAFIPVIGGALAFALAVAAIVFLGVSVSYFRRADEAEGRLQAAEDAIAGERRVFDAAVDDVLRTCPRDCRTVDLNVPDC